jgi:uncharacterized protein (TIGR01244 family)
MSVSDIFNHIQIDELVATAGQPSEAQFREVCEAGYEIVINLAPDGLETSLPDEGKLLEALGIEYHHIPVVWADPRIEQLEQFEELMGSIAQRPTLIHCQANYRVTAFFAMYATSRLGWEDERADALINRIWAARADYQMDETWKNFIAAARQRRRHSQGSV